MKHKSLTSKLSLLITVGFGTVNGKDIERGPWGDACIIFLMKRRDSGLVHNHQLDLYLLRKFVMVILKPYVRSGIHTYKMPLLDLGLSMEGPDDRVYINIETQARLTLTYLVTFCQDICSFLGSISTYNGIMGHVRGYGWYSRSARIFPGPRGVAVGSQNTPKD